jgi:hypothetical protein
MRKNVFLVIRGHDDIVKQLEFHINMCLRSSSRVIFFNKVEELFDIILHAKTCDINSMFTHVFFQWRHSSVLIEESND